jgi:hypothetical protein
MPDAWFWSLPRFASDRVKSTSQMVAGLDPSHFPSRKFHDKELASKPKVFKI